MTAVAGCPGLSSSAAKPRPNAGWVPSNEKKFDDVSVKRARPDWLSPSMLISEEV